MSRGRVPWSLLGAWLAAVVLVVPAGADEFSLTRCLATGSGSNSVRPPLHSQRIDVERHLACYEAQREYELRRQAKETAEREHQRRAAEVEARRQAEAQAKETAEQAAKEKSRARQEAARARKAEEIERAREAKEVDTARRIEAQQETERARRAAQQRHRAEQVMPGACPTPDLMAKCAMAQDPVLEQIRKSQENAARGRPSR